MAKPRMRDFENRRAKLFLNGRSQAVRLPKEFRFEGDEVEVRREGDEVVLSPVRKRTWPKGYWERIRARAKNAEFEFVKPLPPGLDREDFDD